MRTRLLLPALLLFLVSPTLADPAALPPLRIGLDKYFLHSTQVLISCDAPFSIQDSDSGHVLRHGAPGTIYRITPAETGLTVARTEVDSEKPADQRRSITAVPQGSGVIKVARADARSSSTAALAWHRYRGTLTVRREPDKTLRVINTVALEPYLYGVLPAEIGTKAPREALKAQAVAARTYALKNRGKFGSEGFDLDDTTKSEGYFGVDGETPLTNAAVDETRGQVLVYHESLIDAPYSTDCGGMTACDTTGDCPYLQAVRDSPGQDAPDYAADSKYHTWTKTYTRAELGKALAKDPRTGVDEFVSLSLDGFDASGRITTATVAGADGTMKTVTGPQLRQILGYDVFRSTRVTLTVTADGDYRFDGKGWGHGLGMSQLGAIAMASPPYRRTYREILRHYYVGTELSSARTVKGLTARRLPRHGA